LRFLELAGTTGTPLDLTGWQLIDRGAVRLTFPPDTTLAAEGVLVAVDFDPEDTRTVALFRETFGLTDSVVLVGPYAGGLSTAGGAVRLLKPVSAAAESGMALVDWVAYADAAPWPTSAAGQGLALNRAAATAVGHLPASWGASMPTPGTVQYLVAGDLDADGAVTVNDVDGFARVLADPAAHAEAFGITAMLIADLDGSGAVDFDDIDDFVVLLAAATSGALTPPAGTATTAFMTTAAPGWRAAQTTAAVSPRATPTDQGVGASPTTSAARTERRRVSRAESGTRSSVVRRGQMLGEEGDQSREVNLVTSLVHVQRGVVRRG
jgi:hypothetical protein